VIGKHTTTFRKDAPMGLWLFKQEPEAYSYDMLVRDGSTLWDGVANALARQHLRSVQVGDRVLYYHTGKEKAVVGEMRITAGPFTPENSPDPKAVVVRVAPVRRLPKPVTLERIKAEPLLKDFELVRISRLSVMPVSQAVWDRIEAMANE
jgi:predicted RNA-binding protein with PUA-like domain